jgi:serine/threonine protein kinase
MEGTKFEEEIKKKKLEAQKNHKRGRKPSFENYVGTAQYMAPECVHNKESTNKSDSFSLGCLLYQLYFGFPPFTGKSEYLIYLKSTKCEYTIPEGLLDEEGEDLIKNLILVSPKNRLTVDEILSHKYFELNNEGEFVKNTLLPKEKYYSVISKILAYVFNCDLSEIENKTNKNYLTHYDKVSNEIEMFCFVTEINFKVLTDKIKSDYKQAKEYSNALSDLSNNVKMTKDKEEDVKDDTYDKLGLVTIHLTNYETEFKYYFNKIISIINSEGLDEKDYLYLKIKRLRAQLEYEIFNKEFEETQNNNLPTIEEDKKTEVNDSDKSDGENSK